MNIQQALLTPGSGHGRSGKALKPEGVIIHYVGNPGSSAIANRNYFENGSGGNKVSAHYIVGLMGEIVQCVPENERAAHAGKAYADKYKEMAKTNNSRFIGIEICHPDAGGKFSDVTYASLVELTADICRRYEFDPKTQVLRHYDVTGKSCPLYYVRNEAAWAKLITDVTIAVSSSPVETPAQPAGENDAVIWDFLSEKGLNAFAAAGIMGNLFAESGLKPTNLQNNFEKTLGMTDDQYTAAVDSGAYTNFTHDGAGYGLVQWTFHTRKQALLDFAKASSASIGGPLMQLEFLWKELQGYASLMNILKSAKTVREASDAVLLIYERPADQSVAVQEKRAGYGQGYFDRFAAQSTAEALPDGVALAPIQINGAVFNLPCTNIEGRLYVRLNSLCEALEFKLRYDESQGMAVIETR